MNFKTTREFNKDFKKLSKKYRTLNEDFLEFKKILKNFPFGIGKHFCVLTKTESTYIIKARFFCQSLKKKDLRIIYAYIEKHQEVELIGVEFIELYFKGNKEREDMNKIKKFIENIY